MTFVAIPQTARAVLRYQQGSQERQTVLHYKKTAGAITGSDLLAIVQELVSWWNGPGKAAAATALALFEVTATDISVANGAQQSQSVSPAVSGTVNDVPEPGNVTSTISWRTGQTGKRYRGRTYWPGYTDSMTNDDSTVNSTQLIRLSSAATRLLAPLALTGIQLAVASQTGHFSTPIIAYILENVLDSQRRRLPKRGI